MDALFDRLCLFIWDFEHIASFCTRLMFRRKMPVVDAQDADLSLHASGMVLRIQISTRSVALKMLLL